MALNNQNSGENRGNGPFNYFVIFILGLLIATNAFIFWQFYQLNKTVDGLRTDTVNIIQAYNNLVNTLSQQGTIKPQTQAQAQPKVPTTIPNQ